MDGALPPFQTHAEFQEAHEHLLAHDDDGLDGGGTEADEKQRVIAVLDEIRSFLRRGRDGGAYLDEAKERRACQALLDYWASQCYAHQLDIPRPLLAPHDASLLPTLADDACTYVGLEAFDESDARHFFGRDEQVTALVERLKTQRLVVVTGASGSGKSSLVLAGLLPALKRDALPGSKDWRYLPTMVPGFAPLQHLAMALAAAGVADPRVADLAGWVEAQAAGMRNDPAHAARLLTTSEQPAVVIVDQFEEALTLRTEHASADYIAFVANLRGLVESEALPHRVILTMRKDVEPQLAREYPDLNRLYGAAAFPVYAMESTRLREAIEKPAAQAGLKFQEGVVDELIKSVVGEDASLPLLQFSLMALWERRKGNLVTHEAYREVGSPRQAMAAAANRLYESLPTEQQLAAQRVFVALSRPGEGGAVFRNRTTRRVLHGLADPNNVDVVLEKFAEAHLLRVNLADTGSQDDLAEVTHESLLRNWDLLDRLFAEQRGERERKAFLRKQAEKWREATFDEAFLLSGLALQQANSEFSHDALTQLEREFLAASNAAEQARLRALAEEDEQRRAVERARVEVAEERAEVARAAEVAAVSLAAQRAEANRRIAVNLRRAKIALAVTLLFMAVTGILAFLAWRAGDAADVRLLVSDARLNVETDAVRSIVLAAEAARREPTRTLEMAGVVLEASRVRVAGLEVPASQVGDVDALALDPEGRRLLTASVNGVSESLLDDKTGAPTRRLSWDARPSAINLVAYSPDGRHIAAATDLGISLWSGAGNVSAKHLPGTEAMQRFSFSGDGRLLAAVSSNGRTVSVWSVSDGALLLSYRPGKDNDGLQIYGATFSEQPRQVVFVKSPQTGDTTMRLFVHAIDGLQIDPRPQVKDMLPCPEFDFAFAAGGNKIGLMLNPKVCLFDVRRLAQGVVGTSAATGPRSGDLTDIVFSLDGRFLVRLLSRISEAQVVNMESGELWRLQAAFDLGPRNSYEANLAISGNGDRLAIKGQDGSIRIFDLDKAGSTNAAARWISPDEKLVVVPISNGLREDLELRDLPTGKVLRRLNSEGRYGDVAGFVVSADGRTLLAHATPPNADKTAMLLAFDLGSTAAPVEHRVERLVAWNADLALVREGAEWLLYVGQGTQPVFRMPAPDASDAASACGPRWRGDAVHLGGPRLFAVQTCSTTGAKLQVYRIDDAAGGGKTRLLRTIERTTKERLRVEFKTGRVLLLSLHDAQETEVWDLDAPKDGPAFTLQRVAPRNVFIAANSSLLVSRRASNPWELRDLAAGGVVLKTLPADFQIDPDAVYAWAWRDDGDRSGIQVKRIADQRADTILIKGAGVRPAFSPSGDTLVVEFPLEKRTRIYRLPATAPIFETDSASFDGARVTDSGRFIRYGDGRLVPIDAAGVIKAARERIEKTIDDRQRCRSLGDERACVRHHDAVAAAASAATTAASTSR